ncbi:MAG: BACON domain-containing protein [Bacteroides sp.]|nr:BACON domain-containing protein [Bacteroides sp.]
MKKKHLLFLLLLIGLSATAGCSSGGGEEIPEPAPKPVTPTVPEITINSDITTNGLTFSNEGGTQTISFSTNVDWTLSITDAASWCTPSVTQGTKGNASVTFTVTKNEQTEDRKGNVTIKASTASKSFSIRQEQQYILSAKADKDVVSFKGGSITIEIESNVDFQTSVNVDWIKQKESKGLTQKQLIFEVEANTLHEQRKAEIIFSYTQKNLKQTIVITQEALPADDSSNPTGNIGDITWG